MLAPVLAALRQRPEFAALQLPDLEMLPGKGTAHGHVRIRPAIGGRHLLARVCYAWPGDAAAAARLSVQADAFRTAAASQSTPRLHVVIAPTESLPGGLLVVDEIAGRPPKLPYDFAAIARSLADMHAVALPHAGAASGLPRSNDLFSERLALVEQTLTRYLRQAGLSADVAQQIEDELTALRGLAPQQDRLHFPPSLLLTDTHPGNFLVDAAGKAWFVDLEKAMIGGARACDLAHATLYTSTRWDPDVDAVPSLAETRAFYRHYLDRQPPELRESLRPALLPARRLIWLRTTSFCIRWKVETSRAQDPTDPMQWSSARLDERMRMHNRALLADVLSASTMRSIRAEWLEDRLAL